MDKTITYPGSIPLDTDVLQPQRNAEIALGRLMQAVFGTSTVIDGLTVTQQASPNMTVQVGAGMIVTSTTVDPTGVAYGSLALDAGSLVKAGINQAPVNMTALVAPGTAGQSQNWLVEAQFLEADNGPTVLPYYNSGNPAVPYTGPANAGTSQSTRRTGTVQLQWKAGTAAATGSQNTPTPDAGWVGVAIVTVANGQATITNANIAPYSAAPFVPTKLPQLRKQLTSNLTLYVAATGGSDTANSGLSASSPFATIQKAWNYIAQSLDLNGFSVTVSIANGSYSTGLNAAGQPVGFGSGNTITFVGNTGSPSSVAVTTSNAHAILAQNGAVVTISGMTLSASGTSFGQAACTAVAISAAAVIVGSGVVFGACPGSHMWANGTGTIQATANYTISGSAAIHLNSSANALLTASGITVTLTGTPAFGTAYASVQLCSVAQVAGCTFTGSATGPRYAVQANGVVSTNGAGATYLPGSTSGSTLTGGQYV